VIPSQKQCAFHEIKFARRTLKDLKIIIISEKTIPKV